MYSGSWVGRDIALDSSFPVVLADLLGIISCICEDDCRMNLYLWNCKRFECWFVELGIVDICRCNGAGERKAVSLNLSAQLAPFYFLRVIIISRFPFLTGISLVSVEQ